MDARLNMINILEFLVSLPTLVWTSLLDPTTRWFTIANIVVLITGPTAVNMTQSTNENIRKYACIVAMFGQPGWFYTMYVTQNWGILLVCFFYLWGWLKGLWNWWIKPYINSRGEY